MDIKQLYEEQIRDYRGTIIDKCIFLERIIDVYIATHFCGHWNTKTTEFIELLISTNRIVWENKVQIFKILIDRHNKPFADANKGLANAIIEIITHRNVFAHYLTAMENTFIEQFSKDASITLLKFKNSAEYVTYSQEKFKKILSDITDYTISVGSLLHNGDI